MNKNKKVNGYEITHNILTDKIQFKVFYQDHRIKHYIRGYDSKKEVIKNHPQLKDYDPFIVRP